MPETCAIYALTRQGLELALGLAPAVGGRIFAARSLRECLDDTPDGPEWFGSLSELLRRTFRAFDRHVFISATGIAVRCIAPLLDSKTRDPAVLVLDQRGRFVISLLSGHLGGANAFAGEVAALTEAAPVITTATEVEDLPAVDRMAAERGLALASALPVRHISAALLAGRSVGLHDPENRLGLLGGRREDLFTRLGERQAFPPDVSALPPDMPCVLVTEHDAMPASSSPLRLFLHPKVLAAGVGCKRGTPADDILKAVRKMLRDGGFAESSLACLASASIKADEEGLRRAARALGVPLLLFAPEELVRLPVTTPSAKAREVLGLDGVCEPAALAAAALLGRKERDAAAPPGHDEPGGGEPLKDENPDGNDPPGYDEPGGGGPPGREAPCYGPLSGEKLDGNDPPERGERHGVSMRPREFPPLLVPKTKGRGVTVALARFPLASYPPCREFAHAPIRTAHPRLCRK